MHRDEILRDEESRQHTMTLDEWVERTPGMAQLKLNVGLHVSQTLYDMDGIGNDHVLVTDLIRCIMTSIRQTLEETR